MRLLKNGYKDGFRVVTTLTSRGTYPKFKSKGKAGHLRLSNLVLYRGPLRLSAVKVFPPPI